MKNKNFILIILRPEFSLLHQHLDYWRDNRSYIVKRDSRLYSIGNYGGRIEFGIGADVNSRGRMNYRHNLTYEFRLKTNTPDLTHLIDIENDADPLNISLGNPDLKNSLDQSHNFIWKFTPNGHRPLNNTLNLSAQFIARDLVRGYTYDRSTGVRRNRTYNVDGNNSFGIDNTFNLQFGAKDQFSISSTTSGNIINSADMIGVDTTEPTKSTVNTKSATEKLRLGWQIGKQHIEATGQFTTRHTSSTREDFSNINASHYSYGVIGQFRLPAGFGLNTDFILYTRHGYGMKELDTTDAIWNVRLTYTPRGGRWVFMADGFDMLHQLSNVNYAINAKGRTVTYTNALPRYMLLTVQYRFNKQPKKR